VDELIDRVRTARQDTALGELFDPWEDIDLLLGFKDFV
jgi:hypothetical protein